jgi:hypothetical protein
MESKAESRKKDNSFLGKKTRKGDKIEDRYKIYETDNSSQLLDTTAELSSDNIISLEENSEFKKKLPGFDDLKIPSFLNDFKINENVNKAIKKYSKMKDEFGSSEMAKLYLIDITRLYEQKRK